MIWLVEGPYVKAVFIKSHSSVDCRPSITMKLLYLRTILLHSWIGSLILDMLLCWNVLEYKSISKLLRRSLKLNGWVTFTQPNFSKPWPLTILSQYKCLTRDDLPTPAIPTPRTQPHWIAHLNQWRVNLFAGQQVEICLTSPVQLSSWWSSHLYPHPSDKISFEFMLWNDWDRYNMHILKCQEYLAEHLICMDDTGLLQCIQFARWHMKVNYKLMKVKI